jgi:hypothetical protein
VHDGLLIMFMLVFSFPVIGLEFADNEQGWLSNQRDFYMPRVPANWNLLPPRAPPSPHQFLDQVMVYYH